MTAEHAELLYQLGSLLGKYKGSIEGIERSKHINTFFNLDDVDLVFRDGQLNILAIVCADLESILNEVSPKGNRV